MKPYQIIASSSQCFNTYYIISDYDTLAEAEQNYDNDIKEFQRQHRKFWLCECYGYNAIIKDNTEVVEQLGVIA